MELIETLNRTMKLAMDEGLVSSYEEAQALFGSFRLRIHVQPGFSAVPAAEAATITLLNAAPKTFLGGVELVGPLHEQCTRAWFAGKALGDVAKQFGVVTTVDGSYDTPTIHVGEGTPQNSAFWLGISLHPDGFTLSPDGASAGGQTSSVEAGVAAAGAALNEAFQHAYRKAPLAGQREVCWSMPCSADRARIGTLWLIGLGHLGQAFLWTLALAGGDCLPRSVRLTDYDTVSLSSLSTCLLVRRKDVGRKKVDVIAEEFESFGVQVQRDYERLNLADAGMVRSAQDLAVIAVDNIALRRSLDQLTAERVLEAGIGDGAEAFTRIQLHAFPGPRKARDIWIGNDPQATRSIDLNIPAYQALLAKSGDECGTALVAGRSVATPFVGAFAGALLSVLAVEQGGEVHAWSYDISSL
ncbi:MAG: ThiF family adenylyltransferase [Candidatus Thiodiazotropha endolucinida]